MKILGLNGFGIIGKLILGYFLKAKYFNQIIVNLAPEDNTSIQDIPNVVENEPFFDSLINQIKTQDPDDNQDLSIQSMAGMDDTFLINNIFLKFLKTSGDPCKIEWLKYGVRTVVETTDKFLDPTESGYPPGGSIQGHIDSGAERIVLTSPFRIKRSDLLYRGYKNIDWATIVVGINDHVYDPRFHRFISTASPIMVFVAHMLKPLLNCIGPKNLLSVSVTKVCSIEEFYKDLHEKQNIAKDRPIDFMDERNSAPFFYVTSIAIEDTLRELLPDLVEKGLIAESLGIRNLSGTLIILVANIANLHVQHRFTEQSKVKNYINDIYREAAQIFPNGYLRCDDTLDSSETIYQTSRPIISIQTQKTHTRTAEIQIDLKGELREELDEFLESRDYINRIPITQAVIYGWVEHEKWSYIRTVADNVINIDQSISK